MTTSNRIAEIAKARKVDTEIARLWSLYYKVADRIDEAGKRLETYQESFNRYVGLDLQIRASEIKKMVESYEAQIVALRAQAAPLKDAAIAYDEENYEGWNRFFLVKHIHSNRYCSSFRPTTRVGWLPDVSGLTETEAVGEHGATLCTICFPSAPVELTVAKVDPDVCVGSGRPYYTGELTGRERMYSSPAGYCSECGQWTTLTGRGSIKVRKHKFDETRRRVEIKK